MTPLTYLADLFVVARLSSGKKWKKRQIATYFFVVKSAAVRFSLDCAGVGVSLLLRYADGRRAQKFACVSVTGLFPAAEFNTSSPPAVRKTSHADIIRHHFCGGERHVQ